MSTPHVSDSGRRREWYFATFAGPQNTATVGEALRASGLARDEVFVTTKLDRPYAGRREARKGIEHSLSELKVDLLDLVLIHEPYAQARDMWHTLVEAREQGLARHIGVSNFQGRFLTGFLAWCDAEGLPQPDGGNAARHRLGRKPHRIHHLGLH